MRFWLPGLVDWWFGAWWTLPAAAAALVDGVLVLVSRRPARSAVSPAIVWEQVPGQPGLIARTTTAATGPVLRGTVQPRRGRDLVGDWPIGTGFAALAALVFTGLSLSATQQGQFNVRYARAIDQIGTQGPDHLQTRLSGIHGLERLAHDSPRDQPTIRYLLSPEL